MLFLGAPGTGKTMLSKAIATSFNCPFVTIPGSGFAQTFIGMDAVIVRFLARKAKKMADKWGGQCIVFIDEIDAVGMRRASLGIGFMPLETGTIHDTHFFGRDGRPDLAPATSCWRPRRGARSSSRCARSRRRQHYPAIVHALANGDPQHHVPAAWAAMGGGLALNQLLVVMDGIDEPPLMKRVAHAQVQHVPGRAVHRPAARVRQAAAPEAAEAAQGRGLLHRRLQRAAGARSTRRSPARAAWAATSTSARPRGRTGATSSTSTWARSPTRTTSTRREARDELARITNGYSPAMIDQACSLALTYAHSDGRGEFSRQDLLEAMTTVESGVAIGQPYPKHEERATAIHEAGHAVCGHVYMENLLSTRLSIRKRGSSGGHHQAMAIEDRFGSLALRGGRRPDLGPRRDGRRASSSTARTPTASAATSAWPPAQAAQMVGRRGHGPGADRPLRPDRRPGGARGGREEGHGALREARRCKLMHRSAGMNDSTFGAALERPRQAQARRRPARPGVRGRLRRRSSSTRTRPSGSPTRLIAEGEMYGDDVTEMLDEAPPRQARDRRPG